MLRLLLLLLLLLSLSGATYVLLDLRSDGPLAMTFCFGLPVAFILIAVVMGTVLDGAVLSRKAGDPGFAGRCDSCDTEYKAGELQCEVCGRPTDYYMQAERMRRHRADYRQSSPPVREAFEPQPDREPAPPPEPTPHAVATAAKLIVAYAGVHEIQVLDTIDACLLDPAAAKRAYLAAARRLHPDTNAGAHLPEWYSLRNAMDVLNRHHQM